MHLLLLLLFAFAIIISDAWFVTPPTTKQDWQQLASLVVTTFDAPSATTNSSSNNMLEQLKWNLVEKTLTEEATYRQYVSTARRMKGTKYAIFVAKHWGTVIGMAELGINHRNTNNDDDSTSSTRRATIGVLCVDSEFQNQGVGVGLVHKCREVAATVWNETELFAEVEPENKDALAFFETKCGFSNNNDGAQEVVMVSLRGRGGREERPHLLLSYNLTSSTDLEDTS